MNGWGLWQVAQPAGAARERMCAHLGLARLGAVERGGCQECLRAGTRWVNLLVCLICYRAGCCDSSPGRHAHRHAESSGHPLARTLKEGEDWAWCYLDEVFLEPSPTPPEGTPEPL